MIGRPLARHGRAVFMQRGARTIHEAGQALSEFLVVATFLLIPLLLLIPVVASLISQRQDVELAARYAAWERTVWNREAPSGRGGAQTVKSDAQIAREIDARVFSADRTPITSDGPDALALDSFSHLPHGASLLRDRRSQAGPLPSYAAQESSESDPSGIAGLGSDAVTAMGSFTRFDLNRRGQFDATVSVDVVDLTALFGARGVELDTLRLTRRNRLLAEAWTGGAKRDVEHLVSGLLPQQFMDGAAVRNVQDFSAFAPGAREIRSDWLRFGHVDIDPLPSYRLGPAP